MKMFNILWGAGLVTLLVSATSAFDIKKDGECAREIRLKVVLADEGCDVEPAIYQVFNDGMTRIVCLQENNESNPVSAQTANSRLVHTILATIDLHEYYIKATDTRPHGECASEINYVLQRKYRSQLD